MTNRNQGEGDRESARHYNDAQHEFAQSGKVEQAAREAAPRDEAEARQMQQAEQAGRRHAKDEDPTVPGANATHRQQQQQDGTGRTGGSGSGTGGGKD